MFRLRNVLRLMMALVVGAGAELSLTTIALAQTQPVPPEYYTLDPRGVDLVSGSFNYAPTEVVIGDPGAGGIAYGRAFLITGTGNGWRDTLLGTIDRSGSTYTVSLGRVSEVFTKSGSLFTPVSNNGSTLSQPTTDTYRFTSSSGAVAEFKDYWSNGITPYQANVGLVTSHVQPNGERLIYSYTEQSYCLVPDGNEGCAIYGTAARLQSVTNNRGYMIHYKYAGEDAETDLGAFLTLATVTGVNRAVDPCGELDSECPTFTRTWPSVTYDSFEAYTATDQSGRVTTYSYASPYSLSGIRFPGSSSDDIAITYSGSLVSTVTDASGAWSYTFGSGPTRTATASGPLDQSLTVVSNLSTGRATSITQVTSVSPAVSRTWSFQYDSQRRLTRLTQPEGNYSEFKYDARGNLTQTTETPKPGSGLTPISFSATYPSTCTNPVTCNRPKTSTDVLGHVTDYTWDSTHGGLLTVTLPAPGSGLDRPQTRYTYAAQTAYYKNSGGTIVPSATSVTLPTAASACATGTSCANAANEVRATNAYGSTGVANNLLLTSVSRGSGASPFMAVVGMTYTPDGDLETVDGPLYGDITSYRYDNARQLVGVIGPDPDGSGALLNRAHRLTYNNRGQVTWAETGTAAGGVWANFSTLLQSQTIYDSAQFFRPVETRELSAGGAVSSVESVTYDAAGRPSCVALRMNPASYSSLPSSACTAATTGGYGPDRITQFAYDPAGRARSITSADGTAAELTESLTYTANGLMASLTDGEGNVSIMEHDAFDRQLKLRYPNFTGGGTSTSDYEAWTWNANGLPATSVSRAGDTTAYTWDSLNRLTTVNAPSGTQDLAYTYDNLGRMTSAAVPSVQSITTTWDALSRQISEYSPTFGTVGYEYDAVGQTTRITWPDGYYAAYDYDLYGSLKVVRENGITSGVGVLASYAYDNLGQLAGVTRGNGATSAYGYDAFARLNSLAHNPAGGEADVTFGFSYNPADQIVGRTVSNDAYVFSPATAGTAYTLNGLNQVTEIDSTSVDYDDNQNLITGTGWTYAYDDVNRLQTATDSATATFVYDAHDRLLRSSGVGPTRYFLYAGDQAIAEYDDQGAVAHRHVPGLGLDDVVTSYAGSGTGSRSWLLADERGSVITLTDASGAATTINRYDEYGVSASGNAGRFQYTGQAWLAEAGVYHYRARSYLPQFGRFLQPDPIGYRAGLNLYTYVAGDPTNLVDPLGLDVNCGDVEILPDGSFPCNGKLTRRRPVFGGFNPGIFGSGEPGRNGGGGGSYFGYMPPLSPVRNTPESRIFEAEVDRVSAENAILAEPIVLLTPGGLPSRLGRLGRVGGAISRACNCFVAGTGVLTEDGLKSIEGIVVGDLVVSRDEVTGETSLRPVIALIAGAERQIWEVVVETVDAEGAARQETIGTTEEHPWRLVGGDWAETAELYPGAELVTVSGGRAVVVSVVRTDRVERTYNFEVEGFHTYFVGSDGVWVHNACRPDQLTYLYQKVDRLGRHLKIGITSNPSTRYTLARLAGGRLRIIAAGRRDEMLALERYLHRNLPRGPEG